MLKSLINKLLSFFAVAQETPEIENVEHGSGPGWSVVKVRGRQVYVPYELKTENGVKYAVTDLTRARYVNFRVNYEKDGGRGQPGHDIEWLAEPLSEETHAALVRSHERSAEAIAEKKKRGEYTPFEVRLISLYPPHPKGSATSSQVKPLDSQLR